MDSNGIITGESLVKSLCQRNLNRLPMMVVLTVLQKKKGFILRQRCSCNLCTETEQGIFEQVLRGDIDFMSDPWPSISESAKDLIRKMLHPNPKRRFKAHQVLSKLTPPLLLFCESLICTELAHSVTLAKDWMWSSVQLAMCIL